MSKYKVGDIVQLVGKFKNDPWYGLPLTVDSIDMLGDVYRLISGNPSIHRDLGSLPQISSWHEENIEPYFNNTQLDKDDIVHILDGKDEWKVVRNYDSRGITNIKLESKTQRTCIVGVDTKSLKLVRKAPWQPTMGDVVSWGNGKDEWEVCGASYDMQTEGPYSAVFQISRLGKVVSDLYRTDIKLIKRRSHG